MMNFLLKLVYTLYEVLLWFCMGDMVIFYACH